MLVRATLIIFIAAATIRPAMAGAWLRDRGAGFVSLTQSLRAGSSPRSTETSLYAEFGVRDRLTLGLDLNRSPPSGHMLVFARIPLHGLSGRLGGNARMATEIAAGSHDTGTGRGAMARLALSVGRGFDGPAGSGWAAIDTALEIRSHGIPPRVKLDATLGLNATSRPAPLVQLQTEWSRNGGLTWTFLPGMSIRVREGVTWVMALEIRSQARNAPGLRLSLWRDF